LLAKLNKLIKPNEYKEANEIKKIYLKHRRNNALKSYAVKYKANISETQSLFQSYSNAFAITNIKLKGFVGLIYLKYEL